MVKKNKDHPGFGDSKNGQSKKQANQKKPANWQKGRVPNPGRGTTGRGAGRKS